MLLGALFNLYSIDFRYSWDGSVVVDRLHTMVTSWGQIFVLFAHSKTNIWSRILALWWDNHQGQWVSFKKDTLTKKVELHMWKTQTYRISVSCNMNLVNRLFLIRLKQKICQLRGNWGGGSRCWEIKIYHRSIFSQIWKKQRGPFSLVTPL